LDCPGASPGTPFLCSWHSSRREAFKAALAALNWARAFAIDDIVSLGRKAPKREAMLLCTRTSGGHTAASAVMFHLSPKQKCLLASAACQYAWWDFEIFVSCMSLCSYRISAMSFWGTSCE